jgi:hypothetical protein
MNLHAWSKVSRTCQSSKWQLAHSQSPRITLGNLTRQESKENSNDRDAGAHAICQKGKFDKPS